MYKTLNLSVPGCRLSASMVSWDTEAFGFPISQIQELEITDPISALEGYRIFQEWLNTNQIRIVSCRLPHQSLRESMFLEEKGFRFVEMVLHPLFEGLSRLEIPKDSLVIALALESDLPIMMDIAEHVFIYERYHIDPRIDSNLGNIRYGRWVKNSFHHPTQQLFKVMDDNQIVALFIVEFIENKSVYWHLTAIAPQWQGKGYGQRVWRAMLRYHQDEGYDSVVTTISARNIAVLNLYAKLDFRFLPPEMTFHWIKGDN